MYSLLIAEEEQYERMVVKDMLMREFDKISEIYEAKNFDETLRCIQERKIDIIYLSMGVAISRNRNLIDYLQTEYPQIKTLVSITYEQLENQQNIKDMTLGNYLMKPIRLEHIALVIDRLIYEDHEYSTYKQLLGEFSQALYEYSYKDAVEIAQRYIDLIFDSLEDKRELYGQLIRFVDGILGIAREIGISMQEDNASKSHRENDTGIIENRYNAVCLIRELIARFFDEMEHSRKIYSESDTIKMAENYIERHIQEQINLDEVSQYCNMNIYYLSKIFKKETGMNFVTYVTKRKIEIAKYMLKNTDYPIVNIALELSFREANYFTRVFKKETGVSPKRYREDCVLGECL